MPRTNETKLKGFLTRLFTKIEVGKPFTISLGGDKMFITQDKIEGGILPLVFFL